MAARDYRFRRGESGTLVEIYLPRKYRGDLVRVLDGALEKESIKKHLPNRDHCPAKCRSVLPQYILRRYSQLTKKLHNEEFDRILMGGYSVFDVDGAFYDDQATKAVCEPVTVARIILRPNYDSKPKEFHDFAKLFFRSGMRPEDYEQQPIWDYARRRWIPLGQPQLDWLKEIADWQDFGALLIYGYIIRRITDEIKNIDEKEIWVTSYHNPVVNVIQHSPA